MGDEWMNDCLMTYIERSVLDKIDRELIIQQLHIIKPCRGEFHNIHLIF